MKTLMKQLFFACLPLVYLPVFAQEYSIAGIHSDGSRIEENDVLFVDAAGSFRIVNNNQEPVSLQSVTWRLEGLNYYLNYVPVLEESTGNVFEFNLAEDNLVNKSLRGFLIGDDKSSVYYKAKVICSGKTAGNVDINLEFPLLFNFLPGIVAFEIIEHNLNERPPSIRLKYNSTERTTELRLMDMVCPLGKYGNGDGILHYAPLQSDNYLHYTDTRFRGEYFQEFLYFIAQNSFGSIYSDTILVHDLLSTSIKTVPDETHVHIYPNPAQDYIYIQWDNIINIKKLSILNTAGKTIKEIDVFKVDKIDISDLAQGIYILRIEYKNNRKTEHIKLIKN
jgi:hypothetical protein